MKLHGSGAALKMDPDNRSDGQPQRLPALLSAGGYTRRSSSQGVTLDNRPLAPVQVFALNGEADAVVRLSKEGILALRRLDGANDSTTSRCNYSPKV